ncbi:MAG: sigma 54-interacting transcriptional regulator [Bdellovibrionales bacterium]|jgi:two-component system, NtrC family, response regulator HupR/HoxA|nr:sigma 54-interacting transcriptional regulator [Bdellovibrionales bacterium]MBT3526022.1 sigma 54-interacting transcriptional regulator [Bdellovibrionales bacterium]MBT7669148.1 sigma 54-interacting transcriptional regulator [Bdellovibrionales bacterium]
MINWKEISELHVINRLENTLFKWFGVELVFADNHNKICSEHLSRDHKFKNTYFKVFMNLDYGHEYLGGDCEKAMDWFAENSEQDSYLFDSYFGHIKGMASQVQYEGEYLGTVVAYPLIGESTTDQEIAETKKKMVEHGLSEGDADLALSSLKRLTSVEKEYLKEMVALVADEIVTFYTEISKREERILDLNSELGNKYRYHAMIGKSKLMQGIYHMLEKVSNSEASVLIQGDNGTGKELVAKAVHFNSHRKDEVFMAVNCSAFNDNLLDSELFGHVKGAFTGAIKDKKGFFEMANGGTLFLDEIGDTSPTMQVKLLRVLQEGTFIPVGATSSRTSDVRIVAATNKNLKEMMISGEFREDLYYRINVINIKIPTLRERTSDIALLAQHFIDKRCAEAGMPPKNISKKCMEKMLDYPWPGNVRELENEIERLVILAGDDKSVTPDLLSARILDHGTSPAVSNTGIRMNGSLKVALEELEALMIKEGLKRCNFNKSKLSKELGISRAGLIMKVDKYGLDKRKKAANE